MRSYLAGVPLSLSVVSDAFEGFLSSNFKPGSKMAERLMKDAQTVGCCNRTKMDTSLPFSAWPNSIYGSAPKALPSPLNLALPCLSPFLPHVLCSACLFPSFLCVDWSFLLCVACKVHPFVLYFPLKILCTRFLFTILSGFECSITA